MWKNFVEFCLRYSVGKSEWDRAIPVFYNGINFDRIIADRYTQTYKSKRPFHKTLCIDVMMDWYTWTEALRGDREVEKLSFDYKRQYLGMATTNESDGATHNAVRDTSDLVDTFVRFQSWKRKLALKAKLKGSMSASRQDNF